MEKERLISLVLSAQRGEEQAFTELFEAFHDDLYYHIFKAVNDRELAEDLLQESYIEIFQTIGQLNEPTAFVTWSKQIAYHRCTGYFKKRRELLADEDEDGHSVFDAIEEDRAEFIPDEALDLAELKQTIHAMINDLPEEQRTAILMRYYDEISLKEIAEIQGVPENTVKSRLNYGRKSIKEAVESYEKKHGIKLRCVGVVPLLLWLFRETAKDKTAFTASAATAGGSAATTTTGATAGAATGAAGTSTAAATGIAGAGAAVAAGTTAAKTVSILGVKIALPKLIAGIVAVALVIAGIVGGVALKSRGGSGSGSGGRSVDLNDYVTITASQYDGYGSLTVSLDTEKLIKDNAKYLTDENLDTQYFGADTPELAANFVFAQYKPYTLQYENSEYLNNGDKVKFSWETNEESIKILKKILKVKLKYSDFTYKVEGLEALIECDPFENIAIEYSGTAPYGKVTINTSSSPISDLYIYADKTENVTNRDIITLTAIVGSEENTAENAAKQGYRLTRLTMEYTLSGVDSYVQAPEEIPEASMAEMKAKTEEIIDDAFKFFQNESNNDFTYTNVTQMLSKEYVGCYVMTLKPGAWSSEGTNRIVLLYKITATNTEGNFSYYYWVAFDDALLKEGTTFTLDLENYDRTLNKFSKGKYTMTYYFWGQKNVDTYSQQYYGYLDMETFKSNFIDFWSDAYTYQTNIN